MKIRARFAPSPTGRVHIGNIRTAIFNYLFCRHEGGTFLLRIEDTDLERSTKLAIDTLLECMEWLGLDYDEHPPLYQTSRREQHLEAAKLLQAAGHVYPADPSAERSPYYFRIPYDCDSFPQVRSVGQVRLTLSAGNALTVKNSGLTFFPLNAKGKAVETFACLAGFKNLKVFNAQGNLLFTLAPDNLPWILDGSQSFMTADAASIEFERREVFYHDLVKGELAKPLDGMRDFIVIRSDGSPVFHLANVLDDIEQRVTHIVRGDDHVENTYRHLFLFHTLGYPAPAYAHLPMIVNKQGKPYSKRDGDAFVGDFREKGILPEALFNYLALIGWSPGDDREKMAKPELIEAFKIERVQRSCAQFDPAKLANLNGLYIAEMPDERFIPMAWKFAERMSWRAAADKDLFGKVASLMKSRTKLFTDIEKWCNFFTDDFEYDPKGVRKFLSNPEHRSSLLKLADSLKKMDHRASADDIEKEIRRVETECGLAEFQLNQPLRVAATGSTIGAGLYETVDLLGTAETAKRIRAALEKNPVPEEL